MSGVPQWLSEFFNAGNSIRLESILENRYDSFSQSLFKPLVVPASEGVKPFVLPFKPASRGDLFFYAGARDARTLSELYSVMSAFLGSSDVWQEYVVVKNPEIDAEKALLKNSPQGLVKVMLLSQSDKQASKESKVRVYEALGKMIELYQERPEMTVDLVRPIGRVLRDFFSACSVHDGHAALKYYEELKGTGNVGRRNLLSLELQALAAGKHWQEILDHPQLANLLGGRIPIRVTTLLLRALGHSGLYDLCGDNGFSSEALERVRARCDRLGPLFLSRPPLENYPSFEDDWKIWAIGAATVGTPNYSKHVPDFIDRAWLNSLAEWSGTSAIEQSAPKASPRSESDDINAATVLLQESLTASSDELDGILARIEAFPAETLETIKKFPRLNELWSSLRAERRAVNRGWSSWFEDIEKPNCDIEALEQECISNSPYWEYETFDPNQVQEFLISQEAEAMGVTLRNILPILMSWLEEREISCTSGFWGKWVEFLALDDVITHQDVAVAANILNNFLDQAHTREEYSHFIEAIEMLWDKGSAISNYFSMLDIIELLLESACPEVEDRKKLWQSTQVFALNKWNRLAPAQQDLTKRIACEILGEECLASYPDELSTEDNVRTESTTPNLAGKLAGIYTLTEGAGRRAKAVLEELFTGLTVETNNDHVATSSLINLAKKSDYFIFSANSSKHQAFYPVNKIRNDLIYPRGKGSSSIIDAFLSQLDL